MVRKQYKTFYIIEYTPEEFKLIYWDKTKNLIRYPHYFSGGFFAYYAKVVNGKKIYYTLPVANICADNGGNIPLVAQRDINEWTNNKGLLNNKVILSCDENGKDNFHNKNVSTLLVYNNNNIEVKDIHILPSNIKYAISGVPCIRDKQDVDWEHYVEPQGWKDDVMRATYRNWLAIKDNNIFLISGRTRTTNYVYGMEFFKAMKDLNLEDCIGLDGGGSYRLYSKGWLNIATAGARTINNIGVIG